MPPRNANKALLAEASSDRLAEMAQPESTPQDAAGAESSSSSGRSSPGKATTLKPMDRWQTPCVACVEHLVHKGGEVWCFSSVLRNALYMDLRDMG